MKVKKEADKELSDDFYGGDSKIDKIKFKIEVSTIILGILLLSISIIFFALLNAKTGSGFGFIQIIFSIVLVLAATVILAWVNFTMAKNKHLGLVVGLLIWCAFLYALFIKFRGPNTIVFAVILSLIVLTYLFFHFWKNKKNSEN
ncbi:MAG: hypothetical protein Q8P57_01700 [Candidatus Pacearchaeota archaeon]|nr:hypothetical protein [Candidatus Pacearchaeota archaeon]